MLFNSPSPAAGVLQSGDSVQAGGAAGCSDQEEHLFVPGRLQGVPGQTGVQEEEGKTAARSGEDHFYTLVYHGVSIIGPSALLQFRNVFSRHT